LGERTRFLVDTHERINRVRSEMELLFEPAYIREPLINAVNSAQEPKVVHCCVAKFENILDIPCTWRLALNNFIALYPSSRN